MSLNLLVYGATGEQGGPVAHELLKRGHKIRTVVRNPESGKAKSLERAGVQLMRGALDDSEALARASQNVDAVFFYMPVDAWPPKAYRYIDNVINAAKAGGASHIVYSSSGPISEKKTGVAFIDIKTHFANQFHESDFPTIILSPTAYLEVVTAPFTYPRIKLKGEFVYPFNPDSKIPWITHADQARYVAPALERPELAGNKFKISGRDSVTMEQVAETFGKVLGKEVKYRRESVTSFFMRISPIFGRIAGLALAQLFRYHQTQGTDIHKVDDIGETAQLLGLEPKPFEEAVMDLMASRIWKYEGDVELDEPMIKGNTLEHALYYQGQLVKVFATPEETGRTACAWDGTTPRGLGPPVHVHTREHEIFYVTRGVLNVGIEDKQYTLGTNEFAFLPANRPHWWAPATEYVDAFGIAVPIPETRDDWLGMTQTFLSTGVAASCLDLPPPPSGAIDTEELTLNALKNGIIVTEPNPMMFDPSNYGVKAAIRKYAAKLGRKLTGRTC